MELLGKGQRQVVAFVDLQEVQENQVAALEEVAGTGLGALMVGAELMV